VPRKCGLNYDLWSLKLVVYVIEREFHVKYNYRRPGGACSGGWASLTRRGGGPTRGTPGGSCAP